MRNPELNFHTLDMNLKNKLASVRDFDDIGYS